MHEFPAELWLRILRYLPEDVLPKLMGVNRVFHEYSLNTLYHSVVFPSTLVSRSVNRITALSSYPSIYAKRVRRLVIELEGLKTIEDSLSALGLAPSPPMRRRLIRRLTVTMKSLSPSCPPEPPTYPAICKIIQTLINVEELHIKSPSTSNVDHAVSPVLHCIWSTFASSHLSLIMPTEIPGLVAGVCSATVSNLAHLELAFQSPDASFAGSFPALSKLINVSKNTLTSLTIRDTSGRERLARLFTQLDRIPRLSAVRIHIAYVKDSLVTPKAITTFLLTQNTTLQHLALDLAANSKSRDKHLPEDGLLGLELTNLHTLEFSPCVKTPHRLSIARLSRYFAQSQLTSILLRPCTLSEQELTTILGNQGCPHLLRLHMFVRRITLSLFQLLSEKLPGLQELYITGPRTGEPSLINPLGTSSLTWSLHSIGIEVYDSHPTYYSMSSLLMMATSLATPSIHTFLGYGPSYQDVLQAKKSRPLRRYFERSCPDNRLYSSRLEDIPPTRSDGYGHSREINDTSDDVVS